MVRRRRHPVAAATFALLLLAGDGLPARAQDTARPGITTRQAVETTRLIRRIFPTHHLSTDGISEAVRALVGARTAH